MSSALVAAANGSKHDTPSASPLLSPSPPPLRLPLSPPHPDVMSDLLDSRTCVRSREPRAWSSTIAATNLSAAATKSVNQRTLRCQPEERHRISWSTTALDTVTCSLATRRILPSPRAKGITSAWLTAAVTRPRAEVPRKPCRSVVIVP
jgi:hypothetical protein